MTIMYRLSILFKNAFWSDGLYRHDVQICKRTELSVEPVPKLAESVKGWRFYTLFGTDRNRKCLSICTVWVKIPVNCMVLKGMEILYTVWDGQKPEMSEHMHCLGENSCQLYGILVKEKCCFCDIFILSNNQLLHRERSVWHVVNTK